MSRRRAAATGGESGIPLDQETNRCVQEAGYELDDILPYGEYLTVWKKIDGQWKVMYDAGRPTAAAAIMQTFMKSLRSTPSTGGPSGPRNRCSNRPMATSSLVHPSGV